MLTSALSYAADRPEELSVMRAERTVNDAFPAMPVLPQHAADCPCCSLGPEQHTSQTALQALPQPSAL